MSSELEKSHCFKVENKFIVKSGCKKRMWRSLKQILTADRILPWNEDDVLYYSINAPPTFKPTKKYSDISGLPAPYIDRHSKLFYSNTEEFATVRSLPMDITAGYLLLRGASTIVDETMDEVTMQTAINVGKTNDYDLEDFNDDLESPWFVESNYKEIPSKRQKVSNIKIFNNVYI